MSNKSSKIFGEKQQTLAQTKSASVQKNHNTKQSYCVHQPRLTAVANAVVACFCTRTNPIPRRVCGLSLAVALSLANPVSAATFTVTNTNDSGAGSLRQAIINANANPGLDDIALSSVSGNITLTSGQIDITDSVNINGPGAQVLAVDGNGASEIFGIDDVTADVLISDLTLTNAANGSAIDVDVYTDYTTVNLTVLDDVISGNNGSAIYMNGDNGTFLNLTIQNSIISGNTGRAISHSVYSYGSELIVGDSTISDNQGDGIFMYEGDLTVQKTIVSGNTGTGIYTGNYRGGVYVSIENSTISENGDDGINNYKTYGPTELTIRNTTISGNNGYGIDFYSGVVIQNSTITGNDGGFGICSDAVIQNSIVAGNSVASGSPDLACGTVDIEWSLIQVPGSTVLNETVPGSNLIGQDPVLGPLQDNGGPTQTHALMSGSPAINSGDPKFTPPPNFDQRGTGFPRVAGGRVDMGAFESGSVQSGLAFLASLGDINGDGSEDIATLVHDTSVNTVTATVKDAENGSLIQHISFNGNQIPVAMKVMADIDNNGAPELVVLGQGSVMAEIRDSLSGALQNTVAFSPDNTPVDLEIVPDQDGNGIPELAVLGESPAQVEVRDALTGNLVKKVTFTDNMTPKDLVVLPDLNGRGGPDMGVLGEHDNPDKNDRVEIRDLLTGKWVRNLPYGKLNVGQAQVVPDFNNNGTPEVAVLRTTDGKINVLIKDAVSKALVRHIGYDPNFAPGELLVLPDVNGNNASEITVFGKNPNNQTQKAQLKDGKTKQRIRNVFFNKVFDPADLVVIPDINGNGASEIGMLGTRPDNGLMRLIIKDSNSGALVGTVDF